MSITLFGLLAVLGFFLSGFFLWKRAGEEHLTESDVFDVYIIASLWALVAARIGAVALRFDRFGWNPLRWLSLFALPGLEGRIALVIMVLMVVLGAMKRRWDLWLTLDIYTPSILLWQVFLVALFWWQVALLWAVWFVCLWLVERRYRLWEWYRGRRGFARPGLVAAIWILGEGVGFLLIAWVSGDMLSLGAGIVSVVLALVFGYRRSGRVLTTDLAALSEMGDGISKKFHTRRPKHL